MEAEAPKTVEAKLAEAEAQLTEQQNKLAELQRKLDNIPNNPEHFNQLKQERDEAKRKLKEYEDAQSAAKGEFERLANERLAEIESLKSKNTELQGTAEKWTTYEKERREMLLCKIKDEKKKKIAKELPTLQSLEEFVELETDNQFGGGSSNRRQDPPTDKKPIINYTTMK